MAYYFGDGWESTVKPTAATRKYVARVEEVAADAPYLLVAHMYTRCAPSPQTRQAAWWRV